VKKQLKTLIIFGSLIVVLLLTWLGSTLIPGMGQEKPTELAPKDVLNILQQEMTDISYLEVVNEETSFRLLPEEVQGKDGKISLIWSVEGMEDFPFSSAALENLARVAGNLYASQEIARDVDQADLASYGLLEPQAVLRSFQKDGSSHEIKIGNVIPSGYYNYLTLEGSGVVYTVAATTADRVKSGLLDILDKNVVSGIDPVDLTRLVFWRAKDELEIISDLELVGQAGSGYEYINFYITSPVIRTGSSEGLSKLATEAATTMVKEFVELAPADLGQYGLDKPSYRFTLTTDEKEVEILLGARAGNTFYAISNQLDAVFTVNASSYTTIDMKVTEMIDRFVSLESIWTVSQLDADIFGTKFVTKIDMNQDQRADDEEVFLELDGKDAKILNESKKSLYSQFYQRLIGILIEGLDTAAQPENTKDASLVFHIKEDTENNVPAHKKVVEFAKRDEYTYYVFIDGVYGGYYVDGEKAFTSKRTGDEGILVAYKKMLYAIENAVDGIFNTQEGYQID
jgi:hypothetical protein